MHLFDAETRLPHFKIKEQKIKLVSFSVRITGHARVLVLDMAKLLSVD
jgi:hypothetical protein